MRWSRSWSWPRRLADQLERVLADRIALQRFEEGHAEERHLERAVFGDEGADAVADDAADIDDVEPDQRRASGPVRGGDRDRVAQRGRVDADAPGIRVS